MRSIHPSAASWSSEAAFLAAAAAEPNNVSALSNLGVAQDLQGHHAGAQDAYRRALAIAPDVADVKVNLGLSLALSGSKDEAVRVLRDVAADPNAAQDRRKELAGALTLAGDEVDAGQVLSSAFGHPEPNSRPPSAAAEDWPRSASHQAWQIATLRELRLVCSQRRSRRSARRPI